VISGNLGNGVFVNGISATGNFIQGNFIGTDGTGTVALGNLLNGIYLVNAGNNLIGGTEDAAPNIVCGNGQNGILLEGADAGGNRVVGNYVGIAVDAITPLGNGADGVVLLGAPNNTVGGIMPGTGNVIAANGGNGIRLEGAGATGNFVEGNFVGTDPTGTIAWGNGSNGIYLLGASNNQIGGPAAGAANTIAFSGNDGMLVDTGTGNAIRQNSIFSSGNLGIELVNGGNNNQAFPVLTSATSDGSHLTVQGTFAGKPDTLFVLEFFANTTADPSGLGEGQIFLGSRFVLTDDLGNAGFTFVFDLPAGAISTISATATDPYGNTSQFSAWVNVTY
jgi:hypothetical protein